MKLKDTFKDKNNVILMISAALIIVAVIIALVSTTVEKNRIEKNNSTTEIVSTTKESNDKKDDVTNTPDTTQSEDSVQPPQTTTAPADTGSNVPGKYTVATQNDPLGVRAKPSQNAERIFEIAKDSEVTVLATFKSWAFVKVDGQTGWANKDYLTLKEKSEAPKHTPGKYTINTQDDPLGIRVKPESDAQRNGEVPKGTEVEILTVCGEWGYVEYNDYSGWLSFQYLK